MASGSVTSPGGKSKGKNLTNLLKTLKLLSRPEGTTLKEMVDQLKIDRRSVYQEDFDPEELLESEFDIVKEEVIPKIMTAAVLD